MQDDESILPFGFHFVWPSAQPFNPLGGSVFQTAEEVA